MNQAQRQRVSECTEFMMQRLVDLFYSLPQFSTFHQYTSNTSEASRHISSSESPISIPQRVLQQNSEGKRVVRLPRTMKSHSHSIVWRVALLLMVSSSPRLSTGQASSCYSNSECGIGASCVAGDSSTQVQFCVADPPCAGTTVGNCPVDVVAGQLTCIWRPDIDCSRDPTGCSVKNGSYGIYKCVSAERCDAYFGNAACSSTCNKDGKQCNGRGSCVTRNGDVSSLACSCDSGWTGKLCETVVDDSCVESTRDCGEYGSCQHGACVCMNGYSGKQCEIAPESSRIDKYEKARIAKDPNAAAGSQRDQEKESSKFGWFIGVVVAAVVLVLIAAVFVIHAKKKKNAQEENGILGLSRHSYSGDGPPTPKQNIVIM
uniref:Uncharacterized protein AlNc14C159G7735 n=1 Tax=Albugo laibachii Nc14 TaxID=890382 RepID=F0WMP7_9STRA|nr:conserved hypothetical protein [Albugo laibachii Nc14]|eukprot:CCA22581.1 conserved hypothetical protein [Albugo laibachii Nc14]